MKEHGLGFDSWEFTEAEELAYEEYIKDDSKKIKNKYSGDQRRVKEGDQSSRIHNHQGMNGWSQKGISRFNKIVRMVRDERTKWENEFNKEINEVINETLKLKSRKKRKRVEPMAPEYEKVETDIDFFAV